MAQDLRRARSRGLTLIEVAVSICLVMVVVMAAMAARYLTVQQAVRADAYNTAGRLALLLLEGWRSTEPDLYKPAISTPLTGLASSGVNIQSVSSGCPPVNASDFPNVLGTFLVTVDGNRNFYVTLAWAPEDTATAGAEHPAKLHVAVAFRNDYAAGGASGSPNRVSLTTYR